ncbi:glycerol-3-phosphate dehydrogenase/oxidase [Carnimonas nigrificans]|uniref:glycerol-3-phosphate dehydrogenase/oxidase n=1 Tax=Carnimonas nigrificans TaxID=64323 RepID=UPI0004701106|nr:glycerol-3-phosphate dehydrogenase/oxidase [Carnimonas nigrificans]
MTQNTCNNAPYPDRQAALDRIRTTPEVDVLIIGAGINGVGLFRDLALQGVNVLIIDKRDFMTGASAGPSRLIHGGLKYLETGEFDLVKHSTIERNLLLRNAPHFVHPLPSSIPTTNWCAGIVPSIKRFLRMDAKIKERGILITELGLYVYDFFGRHYRSMPRHSMLLGNKLRQAMPSIRHDVKGLHTYYDAAITQAERLGYELIEEACRTHDGAAALNYIALEGIDNDVIRLKDKKTGEFEVKPKIVINAGGAWIDQINAILGKQTEHIGGNKGGHLIIDSPQLLQELNGRMVYFGAEDGRLLLLYPFMGHVLAGTTDIPIKNPDDAVCEEDECEYVIDALRDLFPGISLQREQIIYHYSGVRPLPNSDAKDPGQVSRDHSVEEDAIGPWNVLSLVGGKWTTFRGFSEEVTDQVLRQLAKAREVVTKELPIGGGKDYPTSAAEKERWIERVATASCRSNSQRALALLDRYGTTGEAIARYCAECAGGNETLSSLPSYTRGEFYYVCQFERVEHLSDVLFRRLPIALSGSLSSEVIVEVAALCADILGWDEARQQLEIASSREEAIRQHGVRLSPEVASGLLSTNSPAPENSPSYE